MQVVVGGAVMRTGRVLAARRRYPPHAAGRWELPGGKVDPGEAPEAALVRELREELGIDVEVVDWLPGETEIRPGLVLRIALARIVSGSPEPVEHDEVRWLPPEHLESVDWLDSDRPFLGLVRERLQASGG